MIEKIALYETKDIYAKGSFSPKLFEFIPRQSHLKGVYFIFESKIHAIIKMYCVAAEKKNHFISWSERSFLTLQLAGNN